MKRLMLVAAIVTSFAAQAMEIGRVKNNAGGHVVFLSDYCDAQKKTQVVYGYSNERSDTINGCYWFYDNAFWVKWSHAENLSRYPFDNVVLSKDFLEAVRKSKQTY